ncbi:MAG TPA: hypothetical protein VFF88_06005, partial [Methylocella sp.]|nr:hypothetical protein [Methylocella sp.]
VAMTSLAGCSGESFASILRALGYVPQQRKGPPIAAPPPARQAAPLADGTGEAALTGAAAPECPEAAPEACEAKPEPPAHPGAESPCAAGGEKESLSETLPAGSGLEDLEVSAKGLAGAAPPEGSGESLIEVWRPHRQQHQMRRREGAPVKPAGWRKKETGPPPRPHAARPPVGDSNGATQAAPQGQPEAKSCDPQGVALLPEAARQESAGRRDAAGGGMRSESRRGGWKQPGDKIRPASQERGGPPRLAAAKEKKHGEKPPDPNSPFAKLLELKARLEEKNNTGR